MKKLICLWVAIVFIGCDSDTESGNAGVIMPLAIGNEWHYLIEHYDSTGTQITATGPSEFILTDTTQINGLTGYAEKLSVFGYYYTNKQGGLYGNYCFDTCKEELIVPYPAPVGYWFNRRTTPSTYFDAWDEIHYDTVYWRVTVVATDTLVEVPAGRFLCYKYYEDHLSQRSGIRNRNVYCYAPNRGKVYTEEYHVEDDGTWILDHRRLLTSMSVK
jgi:hypothetical protein